MKKRVFRIKALSLFLVALLCGSNAVAKRKDMKGPLPWTIQIEVFYSGEANSKDYLENLERRILAALSAENCFREIVREDGDLVLRVLIARLEPSEHKIFTAPPTGGPGTLHTLDVSVIIAGTFELQKKDGTVIIPPKKFFKEAVLQPTSPTDDPLPRALIEAFDCPVQWIEVYLCGRRRTTIESRMNETTK